MIEEVINIIKPLNWETIAGMFLICWYFTRDLKMELVKMEIDMKEQSKRTDNLYQMFIDLLKEKK